MSVVVRDIVADCMSGQPSVALPGIFRGVRWGTKKSGGVWYYIQYHSTASVISPVKVKSIS